ncbi:SurA N-terminal domain-containing protein [Oceanobacillus sp. CAU 1775]
MNKKWLVSISLVLLVFLLAACSGDEESKEESETSTQEAEAIPGAGAEMPEPDLEGIPDVVAEINGEELSKEEFEMTYTSQFQQAMMQAQMSGEEVDQEQLKAQVVDALIGQKLIVQEAEKNDFEVSEEEMNETLDILVQQNGLETQEALLTALEEQGTSEDEVMSVIETQIKIDKLIARESGDVEPSEEEVQEMYDMYVAQLEQMNEENEEEVEVPSFEELEPDLIAQIKAAKESETYQKLIEELRSDADITKNL